MDEGNDTTHQGGASSSQDQLEHHVPPQTDMDMIRLFERKLAQNEEKWTNKFNQLKTEIEDKDEMIFSLCQSHDRLGDSLNEALRQLDTKTAEFIQTVAALGEVKKTIECTFKRELAEVEQTWDTKLQQANTNLSEWKMKHQQVEDDNKDLVKKIQGLETETQQMKDEIKLLEEICLNQKSKRGCFGRKIHDREEALERMKTKMLEREMKKEEEFIGTEISNSDSEVEEAA